MLLMTTAAKAQQVDSIAYSSQTDTLYFQQEITPSAVDYRTAGDVLREMPGVFLRTSVLGGTQTVSAQGLNPQHVQVLWNDIPVSSGMLGVSDLSLFTVGYRQEVSYAIQGQEYTTGGLAGVVNIKDHFQQNSNLSIGLKQSVGSFGQSLTHLHHQASRKRHQWSFSSGYERAKNNFKYQDYTVYPNVDRRQENGHYRKWHIYPNWQIKLKGGSVLSVHQEIVSNHRNLPPFLVTPNNLSRQKDFVARQMLSWSLNKNVVQHQAKGFFGYSNLYYEDFVLKRKDSNKEFLSFLRYKGSWRFQPKWLLQYGADFKKTSVKTKNYSVAINEWGGDMHSGIVFKPSLYTNIQAMAKITKRSDLPWYVPYHIEANSFVGKKKQWKLWLRNGMDVRYPTLNDRYWTPGGNLNLVPEKNNSVSLGTSGKFHLAKNISWGHEVELFYNKLSNMIIWLPTNKGFFEPFNIGHVLAYGATVQQAVNWVRIHHSVDLHLSYGWNRSGNMEKRFHNDKSQWVQLPYFPIHSGKMSVSYQWKGLLVNIDGQAYSERLVTRDGGNTVPAYAILNSAVSYTQKIKTIELEGRFAINNFLNEVYEEVRFRPMPQRNYLFTLLITWNYEKN